MLLYYHHKYPVKGGGQIITKLNWNFGTNIIKRDENLVNIQPSFLKRFKNTTIAIKDLYPIGKDDQLLAMGKMGEYSFIDLDSVLEIMGEEINLLASHGQNIINKLRGIVVNPPKTSIMNTFYDTKRFLGQGYKTLIIFLDGFGYHQYLEAINGGYAPFLAGMVKGKRAISVYKPVTNAGFAAMITGKPPYLNGVYSRKQRAMKVPSIFKIANDMGKSSVLIEGHIKILNTEIEPILNIDRNKSGTTDDEVFQSTLESMAKYPDLIMSHFHGIDDMGHEKGDLNPKTMGKIKDIDGYIREMLGQWRGKVIITSDHGMHTSDQGGDHGIFRYEDLIVPYIIIDKE